jgi:flagellar basal-body rod modification protein FlgD
MQVGAISPDVSQSSAGAGSGAQQTATSAFGLGFDALLKIILTQLTYQDPLKPMDNFQFVSQLAQFSQIQIGQTTNERLQELVTAQGNLQAASLLGRTVDIGAGVGIVTGKVTGIAFDNGSPLLTIETGDDRTISGITLGSISQIREGE